MPLILELSDKTLHFELSELKQIGSGGEGSVFLLQRGADKYALKRYHTPSKERFEKVEAAIKAQPKNAVYSQGKRSVVQMAWPIGLVKENGKAVGFSMPFVSSDETMELDFFISPLLARDKRHLEKPNLAMRLQIARNLCSVVNSLHEAGHHFIDFKPQNVKVYPRSLHVCLIDCDSFSIFHDNMRYPATAYSPQFINPVALVNDLHPSKLGEDQDNWAIAVALFMLLNYDLHPYDGKASESIKLTAVDDFVRMGLYAYGSTANALVSPKASSVHTLWPSEIRALFDKAFTDPSRAPKMTEWIKCIQAILENKRIARCDKHPNAVDHLKFLGFDCMQCSFESRQRKRVKSVTPPSAGEKTSTATTQQGQTPSVTPTTRSNSSGMTPLKMAPVKRSSSADQSGLRLFALVVGIIGFLIILAMANESGPKRTVTSVTPNYQAQVAVSPEIAALNNFGFFGRYSLTCLALRSHSDYKSHIFSLAENKQLRWSYVNSEGTLDDLLEIRRLEYAGQVPVKVVTENLDIEATFEITPYAIRIFRLVDKGDERAIVLNGHNINLGEKTPFLSKCE
jgi:DNA-binding helix-hairpin-helix protein with protein kinase domain